MRLKTICPLALGLSLLAGAAGAGPWPRGQGEVFLSLAEERDREGNSYTGLYAEYGLTARDTLGFELGHSNAVETSAMIWWQRALDGGTGPDRFTVSTGIGALRRGGELLPLAQIGASWGRGLDAVPVLNRLPGGGWLALDARLKVAGQMKDQDQLAEMAGQNAGLLDYLTPETTVKLDLTLGWNARSDMMFINQLRLEHRDDTGYAGKLATSLVHDIYGPAKGELGLVLPLWGEGEAALRYGIWIAF